MTQLQDGSVISIDLEEQLTVTEQLKDNVSPYKWTRLQTAIKTACFSAVASLKTQYRSKLNIEHELRVAVSSLQPRFEKISVESRLIAATNTGLQKMHFAQVALYCYCLNAYAV